MIANFSTSVTARKSLGEIMQMLATGGARQVLIDHNANGEPASLAFRIKDMAFKLPVYPEAVADTLRRDGAPPRYRTPEQVRNIAWRIVRDWLRAQLALIDSGMVSLDEIMLPYALTTGGLTALERYRDGTLLLEGPEEVRG